MKSIGISVAIVLLVILSISNIAAAGTFKEVYVDDELVPTTGRCRDLQYGSYITGVYSPENPYDADIDWQLDSSSWYNAGTTGGGNGDVAFWFTLNLYPGPNSVLRVRATEVIPNPDIVETWWCHVYA